MRGELYRRWLADERGLTLSEFVAERRAECRQARVQRRLWSVMGPQMQQASPATVLQQYAEMQNVPMAQQLLLYYDAPNGGLGGLFGRLFR